METVLSLSSTNKILEIAVKNSLNYFLALPYFARSLYFDPNILPHNVDHTVTS